MPYIYVSASTTRLQQRDVPPIVATTVGKQRLRHCLFIFISKNVLSVAIKLTRNTHNFFHILYIMQIYRARTKQKLNKISGLIYFLNSLCAINCPIFASIFALCQGGDTVFRLDCYMTSVLCVAGSLGRRVPYLRKTCAFLIQRRQFNFRLCKIFGIEMQFAQVERGPTPLSTCKFTFVKIDNSFFCIRTTLNDRKISKNARHGSLFLLNGHFTKNKKLSLTNKICQKANFFLILSHNV